MMPRLVRKRPLGERIRAKLNPMDFLLWLSEELETRDWDSTLAGTQMGLGCNILFLLARANSPSSTPKDDVFSDEQDSGWLSFFAYSQVWFFIFFSLANAFYTITRTRKYRLFQANVEIKPSTPSVRRVRVGASPAVSTPLRLLSDIIKPKTAESRAHPDNGSEVWELSIWDPLPLSLRLFCLFGPGHVLVYMLFLPLAPLDPRPSVTVFNTFILQIIMSAQLLFLTSRFKQQAKDTALIQREVMNEYDTKFVHPRLHPVVRDVGTQYLEEDEETTQDFVQTGTPTTQLRRGFQTHANPFARTDGDDFNSTPSNVMKPRMFTPPTASRRSDLFTPAASRQTSSVRRNLPPSTYTSSATSAMKPVASTGNNPNPNFGGSMGVHSHNKSPLKKRTSLLDLDAPDAPSPRNSREMAAYEQRNWNPQGGSPLKKVENRRSIGNMGQTGNPFATVSKKHQPFERYPSRW